MLCRVIAAGSIGESRVGIKVLVHTQHALKTAQLLDPMQERERVVSTHSLQSCTLTATAGTARLIIMTVRDAKGDTSET